MFRFVKNFLVIVPLLSCFAFTSTAFAADGEQYQDCYVPTQGVAAPTNGTPCPGYEECGSNSDKGSEQCRSIMSKYLVPFVKLLSAAVGIVVVAAIIFGGIQFSTSGGDPQKVANAKKHITNAIIALVAYVLLFAFLNFIIPGGLV